jgi:putative flippase GtrA
MISKFFKDATDNAAIQAFRYVLAGTLAYVLDYSMLIMFTETFSIYYLTSAAIAFLLGASASYVLNVTWVFNERTFKDRRLEISVFFAIGAAGLCLNHYCIRFFTGSMHAHYLVSKLISSILVSAVNFSARKYVLFR